LVLIKLGRSACIAATVLGAACAASDAGGGVGPATRLSVFAASSLAGAFEDVGDAFEVRYPNVSLRFNFLASSDLATQIEQGAPADVFASADELNMGKVVGSGLADGTARIFAHNELEVIVARGNPKGIKSLSDLEDDALVVSLCNEECPAGRYALELFDKAGVEVTPDSLETEVKGVVTRVAVGEADAGIVYTTDVEAAGDDAEGIPIPRRDNVIATYPIAVLKDAPAEATDFVDFVLSPQGQDILRRHGFLER
jgi:molybdate transport system substrate-binding protein